MLKVSAQSNFSFVFQDSIENSRIHRLSKHTPFQQLANLSEYGSAATYAASIVGMVQNKTGTLPVASVFRKEWEPNQWGRPNKTIAQINARTLQANNMKEQKREVKWQC